MPAPPRTVSSSSLRAQRLRLERASRLHWAHWLVLATSLALTIAAWFVSSRSIQDKANFRFDRQREHLVELILERMSRYEDALRAGVAFVQSAPERVGHAEWRSYAQRLGLERKYPGINGIGAIFPVARDEAEAWLAAQRAERPDFRIHPEHDQPEQLPITWVEPVEANRAAVGLDMAHEANRYEAARSSRRTGEARITGPIVLVQDQERTPGFLFFVPYYRGETPTTEAERLDRFDGIIYAPFIMKKLMDGVLSAESRQVELRISDGDVVLFDELHHGADVGFSYREVVQLYGRSWTFDVRADAAFRENASSNQPLTILMGGIFIDLLLLALFVGLTRANQRAVTYADQATARLVENESELRKANEELTQFTYRTSHDLVSPLKTIAGLTRLMRDDLEDGEVDEVREGLNRVEGQAERLAVIVQSLLELHRADHLSEEASEIDVAELVAEIRERLAWLVREHDVEVRVGTLRAPLVAQPTRMRQCLENLISNGVKYSAEVGPRSVEIRTGVRGDGRVEIEVEDNGIGIAGADRDTLFSMFTRVGKKPVPGSGLGLYLVKKHVDRLGGEIEVDSEIGGGSCFRIILPARSA